MFLLHSRYIIYTHLHSLQLQQLQVSIPIYSVWDFPVSTLHKRGLLTKVETRKATVTRLLKDIFLKSEKPFYCFHFFIIFLSSTFYLFFFAFFSFSFKCFILYPFKIYPTLEIIQKIKFILFFYLVILSFFSFFFLFSLFFYLFFFISLLFLFSCFLFLSFFVFSFVSVSLFSFC